MEKIIKLNQEARDALKRGVDQVADCAKVTLGPGGRNAILGRDYRAPLITNDGVSIVKDIVLSDEVENLGAEVIKDVSLKTNQEAGDGTTTAMVLAQALLESVSLRLEDPMTLKREIKVEADKVVAKLKEMAEPIKGREAEIATISSESEEIGELIAKTIKSVGKEGKVTVEDGDGFDIEVEIVKGMEINAGIVSAYMVNTEKGTVEYSDIAVLVTNKHIDNLDEIGAIVQHLAGKGKKELVLIARGFDPAVTTKLVQMKAAGMFSVVSIKMALNTDGFKDVAAVCGATLVDKEANMCCNVESLGELSKITADQDKSLFIGKDDKAVTQRVKEVKAEKTDGSKFQKDRNEERVAKLKGGVGIIKVGATTETEREYLKLKIEDAVNATLAAIEEGVVPGGGIALFNIAETMTDSILYDMLEAPVAQIEKNAGGPVEITPQILDPVKVTRTALENACSVVGTLITTDVAIVTKNEDDKSTI